ncbi:MAG: flippase [Gammaproteobacteria bacterium]|nr:flippase [Gammaproteobacteria bacterium]
MIPSRRSPVFHRASLRTYSLNTSWMLAERVSGLAIGLIIYILLARHLSVADFGRLQYAISFCGLLGLLAGLGLDAIMVRQIVKEPDRCGVYLGTSAALRTGAGLAVIAVLMVASSLAGHDLDLQWMTLVISLALLPQAVTVVEFFFQARVAARWSSLAKASAWLAGAAFVGTCILTEAPLELFAGQPLVEALILAAALLLAYRVFPEGRVAWSFDRGLAIQLLREAWPLALSMGLVSLYAHIDRVMVRALLGDEATGLYAAAAKVSEAWYFLPAVIVSSVFPALVRARETSKEHYLRRLQDLFDLMVWMAVLIAVPFSIWSDDLLALCFGEEFRQAGTVLGVHIWTGILVFLGVASGRWMILEGLSQAYLGRTLAGVTANVFGNWLLIPRLGMVGAAVSTLAAQFVVVIAFDAFWPQTRPAFRMKCRSLFPIHRFGRH